MTSQLMMLRKSLEIVNSRLERKTRYAHCHCMMNPSMKCKKVWYEIKVLHNLGRKINKDISKESK